MNIYDLLKGKKVNVKTDVGVTVQLEIQSVTPEKHSEDLEPATRENDWWPKSREWETIRVRFTNGSAKTYSSIEDIDVVE